MTIREQETDTESERQLKVTVPPETMIRLHSIKVLTGKNLTEQVREALQEYFAEMDAGTMNAR